MLRQRRASSLSAAVPTGPSTRRRRLTGAAAGSARRISERDETAQVAEALPPLTLLIGRLVRPTASRRERAAPSPHDPPAREADRILVIVGRSPLPLSDQKPMRDVNLRPRSIARRHENRTISSRRRAGCVALPRLFLFAYSRATLKNGLRPARLRAGRAAIRTQAASALSLRAPRSPTGEPRSWTCETPRWEDRSVKNSGTAERASRGRDGFIRCRPLVFARQAVPAAALSLPSREGPAAGSYPTAGPSS